LLRRMTALIAALLVSAPPAFALTLTGNAEVVEADVLRLEGYRVYLFGAESVEPRQLCSINGQTWECFAAAVRMLQTIVSEGEVSCDVKSGPDALNQLIALCTVNGEDIGERMVRSGFAITVPDETDAYADEMAAAQEEGIGLWQGQFMAPHDWRLANGIFIERPRYVPLTSDP
jgi:endonuclease YncB( thermonuclease family)